MKRLAIYILLCSVLCHAQGPQKTSRTVIAIVGHSVALSWDTVTNPRPGTYTLAYKIYRVVTTSCSASTNWGTAFQTSTTNSFLDAQVSSGSTYCYTVTAFLVNCVDSPSLTCESVKPTPVSARIP